METTLNETTELQEKAIIDPQHHEETEHTEEPAGETEQAIEDEDDAHEIEAGDDTGEPDAEEEAEHEEEETEEEHAEHEGEAHPHTEHEAE